MKQIFLWSALTFSFALANSSNAFSQKCKYVKEQTDPFTKQTTQTASMAIGMALAGWEVILQQIDTKFLLGIRMVYSGKIDKPYAKGKKVMFKLANESTIELTASKDFNPIALSMLDAPFTQWIVTEEVSLETFKLLSLAKITNIKVDNAGNDFLVPKISDRQTTKIMETAACMLTIK